MTQLALNLSEYVNGVAKRHAETSVHLFPGYRVRAVTNGVHAPTWASPSMHRLFDTHLPGWRHEPEIPARADCCIPDDEVWHAHMEAKQALVGHVRSAIGAELDPRLPIVGFACRMTAYKRPDLLFSDLGRLRAIARSRPFQIVLAGKAHPHYRQAPHAVRAFPDRGAAARVPTSSSSCPPAGSSLPGTEC